jgi:hypothetical protein
MRTVTILAMVLAAGASGAAAQTMMDGYADPDAAAPPTIIMPDQLTNPITGDFNAREDGVAAGGESETSAYSDEGETWAQPYSVEGEETLDPESN